VSTRALYGIHIALKHIIYIVGVATSYATKAISARIAKEDAVCVTLLHQRANRHRFTPTLQALLPQVSG